jgi:hypothetical protein
MPISHSNLPNMMDSMVVLIEWCIPRRSPRHSLDIYQPLLNLPNLTFDKDR